MGRKLIDFSLYPALAFLEKRDGFLTIVVGHDRESVEEHIRSEHVSSPIRFACQEKPRGTGDAVRAYFRHCGDAKDLRYTVVVCGDTPLLDEEIFSTLWERLEKGGLSGVVATFHMEAPGGYGRIVREGRGFRIVEEADCSEEMRRVTEVNSGIYIVETEYLLSRLDELEESSVTGEIYLTDIVCGSSHFEAVPFESAGRFAGVNTLEQLESGGSGFEAEKNQEAERGRRLFFGFPTRLY